MKQLLRNVVESKLPTLIGGVTGGTVLIAELNNYLDEDPATVLDWKTAIVAAVAVGLGLFLRASKAN